MNIDDYWEEFRQKLVEADFGKDTTAIEPIFYAGAAAMLALIEREQESSIDAIKKHMITRIAGKRP
jgi:hypothetical protein